MEKIKQEFLNVFNGYKLAYGLHNNLIKSFSGKVNGRAQTIKGEYNDKVVIDHLNGSGASFGVIPLKKNNKLRFAAIDIDIKHHVNPINPGDIFEIEEKVSKMNLPLIACQSKSKGVHLYCFTQKDVEAELLINKMKEWASMLGFGNHEIFPKQSYRKDETEIGNWINLPYYKYNNTVRFAVNKGRKLTITQFFKLVKVMRISTEELMNFELEALDEKYNDAPPCLQTLVSSKVSEGNRNNGLFNFAVYFKKKYPDNWEEKLIEINIQSFEPPLKRYEVEQVIKSISKKDFFYKCNEYPICQFCNKRKCKKRKYGINIENKKSNAKSDKFSFDNLIKYVSWDSSVIWVAEYQGKEIKLTTTELLNPRLARIAILNQCNIIVKNIAQDVWLNRISDLMDTCLVIEDPRGASRKGHFYELFDAFLTDGSISDEKKSLLKGNVYLENNIIYFRSKDLFEYLKNHRFAFTEQDVWFWLKDKFIDRSRMTVNNKKVRVWFMEAPEFYNEETDNEETDNKEEYKEETDNEIKV